MQNGLKRKAARPQSIKAARPQGIKATGHKATGHKVLRPQGRIYPPQIGVISDLK